MAVLLLSRDLMFGSQLSGSAAQAGTELRTASDLESLLKLAGDDDAPLVVIDLGLPNLDVADAVARLRSAAPRLRGIVAFGPHVHEARLVAAREAGCDQVVSRGQLHAQARKIFAGE